MQFSAIILAAFAAVASAQYPVAPEASECSVVTVTETVTYGHTIPVPASSAPAAEAPYPTGPAYVPVPSGTGVPHVPEGTAAPTGTGVYTATPPEFTGAASSVKVAGALAGVGAVAALFL